MRKYRRVTFQDRCQIDALLSVGMSRAEIAIKLGFSRSTISRELKRNEYAGRYVPAKAHKKAQVRYRACRKPYLINSDEIELKIEQFLVHQWSPEQIAGRLRAERVLKISHQGVYNYIRRKRADLQKYFRKHGRRGSGRYLQRKNRSERFVNIEHRPKIVEQRRRLGDWERDGMYVNANVRLLVLVERKSRYIAIKNMGRGLALDVTRLTNEILDEVPIRSFTITNDNGSEFNDSNNQGVSVYHCTPGKPQQRGTIENSIGLLRDYFSTKTDPDHLTAERIYEVATKMNLRPRKCLDYKTPYEVLFKTSVALAS